MLLSSAILAGVAGCGPKTVGSGDTVRVHYTVRLENGEVADSSRMGEPLEVTLGHEPAYSRFRAGADSYESRRYKTFSVPAADATGRTTKNSSWVVGKEELPEDIEAEVGMQLQAVQADGSVMIFTVTAVAEDTITVDGNHPLAGHDLTFDIELAEITAKKGDSGTNLPTMTLSEALSNGKITFVQFGADTCAPCRQMRPILAELAAEYKDRVNIVYVDIYENRELSGQYRILAIPTLILFDGYGREANRHTGYFPKESIIAWFKEMDIE
jgi:FKBP-type peptidyl-prolyl cis-trans isomerase 2